LLALLFIKGIVIYKKVKKLFFILIEFTVIIEEINSAKSANINSVPPLK